MSGASSKPDANSGSGMSSVGSAGVYEAGDQRNPPDSEKNQQQAYDAGMPHSHMPNDSKDERSIANRLANEERKGKDDEGTTSTKKEKTEEQKLGEDDATAPARMHGNEPSKGAKVDKELQDEEAELIAKMDAKKKQKN